MPSKATKVRCGPGPGQADLVPLNPAAASPGLSPMSAQTSRRSMAEAGLYTQLPLSLLLTHTFPSLAISG